MSLVVLLREQLSDPLWHAKWLNTLSLMENCGARLIARSQHPTMVSSELLRHASEEFRHAYQLRVFANRLPTGLVLDYRQEYVLGGWSAYHYLFKLNTQISRLLKEHGVVGESLRACSYLLVTNAIEVRALELYQDYEQCLEELQFSFSVKAILREERHHLDEIADAINDNHICIALREETQKLEAQLFDKWCLAL